MISGASINFACGSVPVFVAFGYCLETALATPGGDVDIVREGVGLHAAFLVWGFERWQVEVADPPVLPRFWVPGEARFRFQPPAPSQDGGQYGGKVAQRFPLAPSHFLPRPRDTPFSSLVLYCFDSHTFIAWLIVSSRCNTVVIKKATPATVLVQTFE